MHIIHNTIKAPKIIRQSSTPTEARFTIAPLPAGYGMTLGNALRRVMLSSIPGARVTGVKIKGVSHEYTTLPGIKDTILDIILNLKGLIVTKRSNDVEWIHLVVKGRSGAITAADIKSSSDIEILNPELVITHMDKGSDLTLDMSIRIEKSVGYLSIDELKKREEDPQVLLLDAHFSPVTNVAYHVTSVRSGDVTNLDSLELVIATSGVMSPDDALTFSSDMLVSYFSLFNIEGMRVEADFLTNVSDLRDREKEDMKQEMEKESYTAIEILGLSPRTLNALVNGEILSVEQLIRSTEAKLGSIKGFGKKAMTEVREALGQRGLKLLGDE